VEPISGDESFAGGDGRNHTNGTVESGPIRRRGPGKRGAEQSLPPPGSESTPRRRETTGYASSEAGGGDSGPALGEESVVDVLGMDTFTLWADRAAAIAAQAAGEPDPANDRALRDQCPAAWWALHDRRPLKTEAPEGLGMSVSVSWNGVAYDVSITWKQNATACRVSVPTIDEVWPAVDEIIRGQRKVSWTIWEPFSGTAAAKNVTKRKQAAKQGKRD